MKLQPLQHGIVFFVVAISTTAGITGFAYGDDLAWLNSHQQEMQRHYQEFAEEAEQYPDRGGVYFFEQIRDYQATITQEFCGLRRDWAKMKDFFPVRGSAPSNYAAARLVVEGKVRYLQVAIVRFVALALFFEDRLTATPEATSLRGRSVWYFRAAKVRAHKARLVGYAVRVDQISGELSTRYLGIRRRDTRVNGGRKKGVTLDDQILRRAEALNLDRSCSICLEEEDSGQVWLELRRCHHEFHEICIKTWAQRNCLCPLCMQTMKPEMRVN